MRPLLLVIHGILPIIVFGVLLILFTYIIVSGIVYADKRILVCEKCGKKQRVWLMLRTSAKDRTVKGKCVHCNSKSTFLVELNKKDVTMPSGWKYYGTAVDNSAFTLFGVKVFKYDWCPTGKKVAVYDPLYNEEHIFDVYSINVKGVKKEFVAGEFSNCVFGFYVKL